MQPALGAAPDRRGRHESSRGFVLAMLLAFVTGIGILLTMAMPTVKAQIQREQEAELIFRGEAIMNAIKAYKTKTGAYPLKLEDLTKVRPRIIRKLYLDPMTREGGKEGSKEGEWELITAVQPGASGDKTGLPIVGVHSKSQKDSFMIYKGKTLISDWAFSAADNLLLGAPGGNLLTPGTTPPVDKDKKGRDTNL
jgi:type II secretory pathway pseudopilin PulG